MSFAVLCLRLSCWLCSRHYCTALVVSRFFGRDVARLEFLWFVSFPGLGSMNAPVRSFFRRAKTRLGLIKDCNGSANRSADRFEHKMRSPAARHADPWSWISLSRPSTAHAQAYQRSVCLMGAFIERDATYTLQSLEARWQFFDEQHQASIGGWSRTNMVVTRRSASAKTPLLCFPANDDLKRIEDGEPVDIEACSTGLVSGC